jgi:hypothetical protein
MSSLESDEDIKLAAHRLGIPEEELRHAIKKGGLWELAVQKSWAGSPPPEHVARVLGLDEDALSSYVWGQKAALRREEERRNRPPSWLEDPPS